MVNIKPPYLPTPAAVFAAFRPFSLFRHSQGGTGFASAQSPGVC